MGNEKKQLSLEERDDLLETLKNRFVDNASRHKGMDWEDVKRKLVVNNDKLRSLFEMEATGGEPDVVFHDRKADEYTFMDCSAESPQERRNVCYDREAWEKRKKNKPPNNAMDMAHDMGVEILTEKEYRDLQKLGEFDLKTSSWVKTPEKIRKLGGALFCDRRYDTVFTYHNGAESYYSVRGFRGLLRV